MNQNNKSDNAYKTIGEVTKELGLIDKKTGRPQTHTLRYWEKQFNQIKPTVNSQSLILTSYSLIKKTSL